MFARDEIFTAAKYAGFKVAFDDSLIAARNTGFAVALEDKDIVAVFAITATGLTLALDDRRRVVAYIGMTDVLADIPIVAITVLTGG